MTREGAKSSIDRRLKVKHRSFSDGEYVTLSECGKKYEFEDGHKCTEAGFWAYRTHPNFDIDWEVVN